MFPSWRAIREPTAETMPRRSGPDTIRHARSRVSGSIGTSLGQIISCPVGRGDEATECVEMEPHIADVLPRELLGSMFDECRRRRLSQKVGHRGTVLLEQRRIG